MARLDDAYSHQDGSNGQSDWKTTLHDTIAAGRGGMAFGREMQEALYKSCRHTSHADQ